MSFGRIEESVRKAEARLGELGPAKSRAPRSDRGKSRLPGPVAMDLLELVSGDERPPMRELLTTLRQRCARRGVRSPSRATVYAFLATADGPRVPLSRLPDAARATLYNLDANTAVPGHQVAFHCFNYGDMAAVSFASGLPWLALYQAARMRGWRPKSRGLLEAVMRVRKI